VLFDEKCGPSQCHSQGVLGLPHPGIATDPSIIRHPQRAQRSNGPSRMSSRARASCNGHFARPSSDRATAGDAPPSHLGNGRSLVPWFHTEARSLVSHGQSIDLNEFLSVSLAPSRCRLYGLCEMEDAHLQLANQIQVVDSGSRTHVRQWRNIFGYCSDTCPFVTSLPERPCRTRPASSLSLLQRTLPIANKQPPLENPNRISRATARSIRVHFT